MKATEVHELPALPTRDPESHKGTFGHVLIAAGSTFMPGAASLTARAAYRSGCGLVTVVAEATRIPAVSATVTEAIFTDWSEIGAQMARDEGIAQDALLAGPGLGMEEHGRLLADLLETHEGPQVLDADALNLIAAGRVNVSARSTRVWTPHPGEFARLTGDKPEGDEERVRAALKFVADRDGVLVLKGHRTVVASRDRYAINRTGNPGMATAGSGDVLGGIIVSLLAQGWSPFDAARLGAHLHGLAGDLAAMELGEISLVASDLIDYLPEAFRELESGSQESA